MWRHKDKWAIFQLWLTQWSSHSINHYGESRALDHRSEQFRRGTVEKCSTRTVSEGKCRCSNKIKLLWYSCFTRLHMINWHKTWNGFDHLYLSFKQFFQLFKWHKTWNCLSTICLFHLFFPMHFFFYWHISNFILRINLFYSHYSHI